MLRRTAMKRSPFSVCFVLLSLLLLTGITSAAAPTPTPEKTGGSIFFDTTPSDATIWLDGAEMGNSPFTYFSAENRTFTVLVRKKGYRDYTDTISVSDGKRVVFTARLIQLPSDLSATTSTTTAPVTTATTVRKSTMKIPTPWPTPSPESPVDPAVGIGAALLGGLLVLRHGQF